MAPPPFDENSARLVRPDAEGSAPRSRAFDASTARMVGTPSPHGGFDPSSASQVTTRVTTGNSKKREDAFDPSTARLAATPTGSAPAKGGFDPSTAQLAERVSPIEAFDREYAAGRKPAPSAEQQTSILGDVGRGIAQAGLSTARTLGLAGAGALEAATLGHAPTAITDPIFRGIDAIKDYQDTIQRPTSTGGRIAEAAGGLVGAIPTLGVGNLSEGQDIIRDGGSLGHALGQTALNAAGDVAGLGLGKLGEKAGMVKRALSQGAANTAFGEASRVAGNAIAPEERQREFDPLDAAINFGAGVGFGLLPHAREPVVSKESTPFANREGGAETPPPFDATGSVTPAGDEVPTAPRARVFPGAADSPTRPTINVPPEPPQVVDPAAGTASPIPDPAAGSISRAVNKGIETGAVRTTDTVGEAPEETAAPGTVDGGVPMMITQAMRRALRESGYSEGYIRRMTPMQAHEALSASTQTPPSPTPPIDADTGEVRAHGASSIPDAADGLARPDVARAEFRAPFEPDENLTKPDLGQEFPEGYAPVRADAEGVFDEATARRQPDAFDPQAFGTLEAARDTPFEADAQPTRWGAEMPPHADADFPAPASGATGTDEHAQLTPIHAALQAIAGGDEPTRILNGADDSTVRAVAAAMGRKYSSKAPADAIVARLGEIARTERVRMAQVAVDRLVGAMPEANAQAAVHVEPVRAVGEPLPDASSVSQSVALDSVRSTLEALAAGEHPSRVLDGADADTVRAVAAALGRKFSPKAPTTAIIDRLSEQTRSDRVKRAQAAIAKIAPANEHAGVEPSPGDEFASRVPHAPVEEVAYEPGDAAAQPAFDTAPAADSAAFKRYFGASKVVDAAGAPKVVHHGTGEDFTVFDTARAGTVTEHATSPLGHFFTEDRAQAQRYAENASEGRPADERVIDAYLSIRKPYDMTLEKAQAIETPSQARALRARLEGEGYDGIRVAKAKTWIAFESGQVKSVDNRGTFDRSNPDILYSRASVVRGRTGTQGLPVESVERIASDFLRRYRGHVPLQVRVGKTLADLYGPGHEAELGNAKGAYHARSVFLTLAADRLSSRADVETTLRHEVLGHYGLNTLAPEDKRAVLEAVVAARQDRSLRSTWDRIDRLYADQPELVRAEEVFADLAERKRALIGQAWDRILTLLAQGLRRIGLLGSGLSRAELQDLARRIGEGIRSGERVQRTFPADDASQFARAEASPRTAAHLSDEQREVLGKIGTLARGEKLPEKWKRLTERWREKLTQGLVDQFAPLKDLDKDAYMQARLSRGTDGALEAMFMHGTPKLTEGALDVTADGKGLRGLLGDLHGEHDLFLAWMAGHRAEALSKEWEVAFGDGLTKRYRSEAEARAAAAGSPGAKAKAASRENLFSLEDIAALKRLDQGVMPNGEERSAAYAKARSEFRRYQKAVLDVAEQAGLIDADSRATWESDFYVPFYRQAASDPDGFMPSKVGSGLVRQQAFEQLKGGTDRLNDLLGNTLANWSHLLSASMRNMAASKAIAAAERMGIAERIGSAEKGSVWISQDGRQVHYRISAPLVVDALTMLNASGLNTKAMRAMGAMKRALSFGVTINPAFRIRNLLRDTLSAMAVSDAGFNPLRNIVQGWRSTGAESETFHKLLASGGAVRFGSLNDGEQAAHAKRLIRMGAKGAQILDTQGKIRNALNHAWEWWKEVGDRGETVNRAVIYERAKARGATHLEAAYEARDLLDFTMGGKWAATRFLVQTVPFLNARAQGLYKLARGAQANPTRFAAVTGTVALASAALYLLQKDDPDYRNLPDWARDTYWCVKLGEKMLFLPKPFEIGALGSVVERGTELATAGTDYQTQDFARSLLGILVDQLSMNPIPQAVRPLTEAFFNYDTFRGRPIDSEGQERLPPADRYTARTSAAAVGIGKVSDVSPQRIEHFVQGYFGWLGLQALNVTDLLARPLTDLPSNPNRDFYAVSNWPVAGDFVKSATGLSSKYVDRFYADQQRTEQLYAAYSLARKAGDIERARDLAGTDAVRLRKLGSAMNRRMQETNQRIRRVTSDRSLGATEKRALLEGLTQQRNRIAEHADEMRRASAQ